jgi:hypothetical protein
MVPCLYNGLLFIAMIAVGCKASKPKRVSAEKTIESNDSLIIGDYEDFYFYADHPFAYIIADPFGNYCFMGTFWGK